MCSALPVRGLLKLFRRQYLSHLLVPALLTFVFVRLWSGPGRELIAYLVGSALLVSSAQRALFDTTPLSEHKVRRVFYRTMMIAVWITMGGLLFGVLALPFLFLRIAIGAEDSRPFAVATLVCSFGFAFVRFWPVYVTAYLYRGTPADLWGEQLHLKLPDLGIAWRLTAVPGAFAHATAPISIATAVAVVAATMVDGIRGTPAGLPADVALFVVVLPFAHLLVLERATALAIASGSAFAAATGVADQGVLWFVRDPSTFAGRPPEAPAAGELDEVRSASDLATLGGASFTWDALGRRLGLKPAFELERIGQALTGAYRLMRGSESPSPSQPKALAEEERGALARRCLEVLRRARPLEARAIGIVTESGHGDFACRLHAEHALLLAAELLGEARSDLDPYESRLLIVGAYRELFDPSGVLLKPEDHLLWLGEEVGAPQVSKRYRALTRRKDPRYWTDPVYLEIWNTPSADLPAGAMLALVPLIRVQVGSRAFEMEDVLPVSALLERYGSRLAPALVEYLRHPEKYLRRDPQDVLWSVDYRPLLEIVARWPRHIAEPIFRSALASGWDIAHLVSDSAWGSDLVRQFENGPYRR